MPRRNKPKPSAQGPPAYITPIQLARRWSVTEGHLRNRRVAGRAPRFMKDGGLVRYSLAEIEAHEQAHTVTSTSTKPTQENSQ